MSLKFNNVDIQELTFNGVTINTLNFNGVTVYNKTPQQPNNKIFYTSTDGNIVTPYNTSAFNANIVSNEYVDNQGVITFDDDLTYIGIDAFKNCSSLYTINLPNSVTEIDGWSFYLCENLNTINLPNSLININYCCFKECSNLENINIPNSVNNIGSQAFRSCSSLKNINWPTSCNEIQSSTFDSCFTSEVDLVIPANVTYIGMWAFAHARFNSITFKGTTPPELQTDAYNSVFQDTQDCPIYVPVTAVDRYKTATNWTSVADRIQTIKQNNKIYYTSTDGNIVTPYNTSSFSGATILSNEYVDNQGVITFDKDIIEIGANAFYNCSTLSAIVLPDTILRLNDACFSTCSSLTSITLPKNLDKIFSAAFGDSGLTSITSLNTTPPVCWGTGVFGSNTFNIYVKEAALYKYKFNKLYWSTWANNIFPINTLANNKIYYTSTDGNIVLPYDFRAFNASIVSNEYVDNQGVITFDADLTQIDYKAFYNCSTLKLLTLPYFLTTIGESAFENCVNLEVFNIGPSVDTIGAKAFSNIHKLENIYVDENNPTFISVDNVGLVQGTTLIKGTINIVRTLRDTVNITSIGDYAFNGMEINALVITDTITSIGDYAFDGCDKLKVLYVYGSTPPSCGTNSLNFASLPDNIYIYNDYLNIYQTTSGWSSLSSKMVGMPANTSVYYTSTDGTVVTPKYTATSYWGAAITNTSDYGVWSTGGGKITKLGSTSCNGRTKLTSLLLPPTSLYIGNSCCGSCSNLESVNIHPQTNKIDNNAFQNAKITYTFIPNNVTILGRYAFKPNYLSEINIPRNTITIQQGCFENSFNITELFIPRNIQNIEQAVFAGAQNLTSITLESVAPPKILSNAFSNTNDCPIYVPAAGLELYKISSGWSDLVDRIQAIP